MTRRTDIVRMLLATGELATPTLLQRIGAPERDRHCRDMLHELVEEHILLCRDEPGGRAHLYRVNPDADVDAWLLAQDAKAAAPVATAAPTSPPAATVAPRPIAVPADGIAAVVDVREQIVRDLIGLARMSPDLAVRTTAERVVGLDVAIEALRGRG